MTAADALFGPNGAVLLLSLAGLTAYAAFGLPRLSRAVQHAIFAVTVCVAVSTAGLWPRSGFVALAVVLALAFVHLGRWTALRRDPNMSLKAADATVPDLEPAPESAANDAARDVASDHASNVASDVASDLASNVANEAPRAGKALGRYVIERQIGKGAMGAVYLATDPKIGRAVAIKTLALSRDFEGPNLIAARERFFREAELAGRLKHPDIVTIFDADEDDGLAYIAMEFLTGNDLLRYTHASMLLPVPQVLQLVARVAQALAHAHSLGVVHRDIKPANVMVDITAGIVKVTDFGIAQVCDAARTRTGIVMGSPLYMSPEQLSGERLDGRSDLYSLGVMLYQLLTARLPHESSSMGTLLRQIAQEAAPDVRSIRSDLPGALADVVALALQKRAAFRYSDGLQMAADLHAVARLIDEAAAPQTPQTSQESQTPRSPRQLASAADPAPQNTRMTAV